ncbi:MAG: hypothetical protein HY943_12545 [Gammaproteobacteria bacterium]|nr:hypothetical protein [Gammaproteobacteria bacterium]
MQLRQVTAPVITLGGALVWGLIETIALQRARRRTAAHDATAATPAAERRSGEKNPKH